MNIIEKQGKQYGLNYIVVNMNGTHNCGFVGVDSNHPLYEKKYTKVELHYLMSNLMYCAPAYCGDTKWANTPDNLWWFGFTGTVKSIIEHQCIKLCEELSMPGYLERQLDKLIKGASQ